MKLTYNVGTMISDQILEIVKEKLNALDDKESPIKCEIERKSYTKRNLNIEIKDDATNNDILYIGILIGTLTSNQFK